MNHQPICRIWSLLRNAGTATLLRRPISISVRLPDSVMTRELNTTTQSVITNSATLSLKEKEDTFSKLARPPSNRRSADQVKKSVAAAAIAAEAEEPEYSSQALPAVLEMKIQKCNSAEDLLNVILSIHSSLRSVYYLLITGVHYFICILDVNDANGAFKACVLNFASFGTACRN